MPAISAATQVRLKKEILERILTRFDEELTVLEGYDGYMTTLTSSVVETIASHMSDIIAQALGDWKVRFEKQENSKADKLAAENKQLKAELKELQAVKTLLDNAKAS